jgi:hypothetical protein
MIRRLLAIGFIFAIKWDNVFAARPAGDAEEPAVN